MSQAPTAGLLAPELIQPNIDVAAKYGVIKAAFPAAEIISSAAG